MSICYMKSKTVRKSYLFQFGVKVIQTRLQALTESISIAGCIGFMIRAEERKRLNTKTNSSLEMSCLENCYDIVFS